MKVLFAEQYRKNSKNGFYFTEKSKDELGAMLDTGSGACLIETIIPNVSFVSNDGEELDKESLKCLLNTLNLNINDIATI